MLWCFVYYTWSAVYSLYQDICRNERGAVYAENKDMEVYTYAQEKPVLAYYAKDYKK